MADTSGGTSTVTPNTQEAINTINANMANIQDFQQQTQMAARIWEGRLAADKLVFDALRGAIRDLKQ